MRLDSVLLGGTSLVSTLNPSILGTPFLFILLDCQSWVLTKLSLDILG